MPHNLATIDWLIIGAYVLFAIGLGSFFTRQASSSVDSFFVGDRKYPWWLAGTSIVATTFAADTPLAVTGIVASQGISGNWIWWSWGIAHLVATFFFAQMWRRSGVLTDAEITELRYSGRAAAFLRGFKAIYFGVFINCLTMAWVIAAMVKISNAFFQWPAHWVIAGCIGISVTYTTLGGFRSVIITDLVQFLLGMGGAILLAIYVVNDFGGMGAVTEAAVKVNTETVGLIPALNQTLQAEGKQLADWLDFIPRADHPTMPLVFFLVFIFAGWWRYAEGNGYMVQRLASCKDERHAEAASLWFAVAHNALRPWPWFIVALGSLVLYPSLTTQEERALQPLPNEPSVQVLVQDLDLVGGGDVVLKNVPEQSQLTLNGRRGQTVERTDQELRLRYAGFERTGPLDAQLLLPGKAPIPLEGFRAQLADREMGYPLMMKHYLPAGLLGLMLVSLLAAFMSTIDTHTNWGASYLVQDMYLRFIEPNAAPRKAVWVSRISIILMAVLAGGFATFIQNIASVWQFLVTRGAGLGSVSAVRWYWSRVTPQAEIAAIGVTTFAALFLQICCSKTIFGGDNAWFLFEIPGWLQILLIAGVSLATWVPISLWGPRNDEKQLQQFFDRIQPQGPGWRAFGKPNTGRGSLFQNFMKLSVGLWVVYGTLFGIGDLILGRSSRGYVVLATVLLGVTFLVQTFRSNKPNPSATAS